MMTYEKVRIIHENYNVSNLETSITFYQKALGLVKIHAKTPQTAPLSLSIWQTIRSASSLN